MSLPLLSLLLLFQQAYMHWTNRIEEERRLGNQIGVDVCTEIAGASMYSIQFSLILDSCRMFAAGTWSGIPMHPLHFWGRLIFNFTSRYSTIKISGTNEC